MLNQILLFILLVLVYLIGVFIATKVKEEHEEVKHHIKEIGIILSSLAIAFLFFEPAIIFIFSIITYLLLKKHSNVLVILVTGIVAIHLYNEISLYLALSAILLKGVEDKIK